MRNQNRRRRQSNQYDKIINENIEVTLPEVIREVLGLEILQSGELPDDVQHTKERKPDALKKVTDINNIEEQFDKIMGSVSTFFKERTTTFTGREM